EPKKKITLTRKQTTEIKAAGPTGKARTIQVEVRKKRVFVKRDDTEVAPIVEEAPKPAAPLITVEELAVRAAEERKAQELMTRQQEDLQKKHDQVTKRKSKKEEEEAAKQAAAEAEEGAKLAETQAAAVEAPTTPAAAPATPAGTGTLHRPAAKAGEKVRPAKRASATAFQEEAARRRALKLRGDVTGGTATAAWRQPKVGRHRHEEEGVENVSALAGSVVREVTIPETISVAELAHKMSVKAAEVIKALMKMGQMVTINQVLDQERAMMFAV